MHCHTLSCSFPKGVRQGRKRAHHCNGCQFTMPFSIDEAPGRLHSESCQQRWQWKHSSSSLPFPTPANEGKQSSHRAGTFGANSDPSMALPGLAAYCTARAFCNLFRWVLTLFSWHWHVRVCSFGGFGEWGRGPAYCLASLNAPVRSSWPSHFSPSEYPHLCWRRYFQAFNLYQNFKTWGDTKQNISVSFITL